MSFQDLFPGTSTSTSSTSSKTDTPNLLTAARNQNHLGPKRGALKRQIIGNRQKSNKEATTLQTIPSGGTFTGDVADEKTPLQISKGIHANSRVSFSSDVCITEKSVATNTSRSTTSRSSLRSKQRKAKSAFSILMTETQQFQRIVSDLESFLVLNPVSRDAVGECPEATWKARILLRSAQDANDDLRVKLEGYEKTLASIAVGVENTECPNITPSELRLAQTSSQKLRRDYDRSHKVLFTCLAQYEKRQHAEVKQLKAVEWSSPKKANQATSNGKTSDNVFEDFFDQAMRQRDLERLQSSMEQVSTIYKELAGLVNSQQEQIDKLGSDIQDASANVDRGTNSFYRRKLNPFAGCGIIGSNDHQSFMPGCGALSSVIHDNDFVTSGPSIQRYDSKITFTDTPKGTDSKRRRKKENIGNMGNMLESSIIADEEEEDSNDDDLLEFIRISEGFHWMMPFETLREDFASVRNDILTVGKGVVKQARQAGRGLECAAPIS